MRDRQCDAATPRKRIAANDNRFGLVRSASATTRFGREIDRALFSSALPSDAVAVIEPRERSVNQSGTATAKAWRLRFAPRNRPFVDPLTGWTGSDDPLAHLELTFPSRESAERYAERHGLAYRTRATRTPGAWKREEQPIDAEQN